MNTTTTIITTTTNYNNNNNNNSNINQSINQSINPNSVYDATSTSFRFVVISVRSYHRSNHNSIERPERMHVEMKKNYGSFM